MSDTAVHPAELLTRTGPGTPCGDLLRRYWQPIALSRDVAPGCPPQHGRIMGEDLVLFRDDKGRLGLLGLQCAHRCADLSYGRVEDGGLRCIYHGWLFDIDGKCLEQPGEPEGGLHRDAVRQKAYPVVERGGAVFAYLGPAPAPLFPNYAPFIVPDAHVVANRWLSNCNFLQGSEGNIDPVHTSYLHRFDPQKQEGDRRALQAVYVGDSRPIVSIEDTRFGVRIFSERHFADGKRVLRVTNFVMPNNSAIGSGTRGSCTMLWHVPIDDTHHWRFEFFSHPRETFDKEAMERRIDSERADGYTAKRKPENRWLQNRDEMDWSYLGMGTYFPVHDLFVTESQGPIHNHRNEHLVTSDIAIARARRLLLAGMDDVAAGRDPRGVVRTDADNDWSDLLALTENLRADETAAELCARLVGEHIYDPARAAPAETGGRDLA
jgi:phenylpropionate dioxygenase-like ring-hydroxylating dioxygenase large terminal subunit